MKPSHERTPRGLDECNFSFNADPIEVYKTSFDWKGRLVIRPVIVAALALAVILWVV